MPPFPLWLPDVSSFLKVEKLRLDLPALPTGNSKEAANLTLRRNVVGNADAVPPSLPSVRGLLRREAALWMSLQVVASFARPVDAINPLRSIRLGRTARAGRCSGRQKGRGGARLPSEFRQSARLLASRFA